MSFVVNDTDRLSFILTRYGLQRITEALRDPKVYLNISKIKVGDANGNYYEPNENTSELIHQIEGGSFYIVEKELLEDGMTVSLLAVFPETFSNCEIREVGIYETVEGKDHLFAISTQQPLLKPSTQLGYIMSVDYYAFLKSQNLANVYEQIVLDPNNQLVTVEKLENLMNTILFTESNLMEQINGNSRVIGLNRVQQVYEKIEENRNSFGYLTCYNNYSTLLNHVDVNNIYSYWVFDYPRRVSPTASIVDISKNGLNLSTNLSNNNYDRTYEGFMSFLDFKAPNYFYLDQGVQGKEYFQQNLAVLPEVGSYIQIDNSGLATGFRSAEGSKSYIATPEFSTSENFSITIRFITNSTNIPLCSTEGGEINIYIDNAGYVCANVKNTESSSVVMSSTQVVSDNQWRSVKLTYSNGTLTLSHTVLGSWEILKEEIVDIQDTMKRLFIGVNNSVTSNFIGSIDLKEFSLISQNNQIASGGRSIVLNELIFFDKEKKEDTDFSMAFVVNPNEINGERTLLARSDYSRSAHIFEVKEVNDKLEVILFGINGTNLKFSSSEGVIPNKEHVIVLSYYAMERELITYIDGTNIKMKLTSEGSEPYIHINTRPVLLYGFSTDEKRVIYANSSSNPSSLYNRNGTPNLDSTWKIEGGRVTFNEVDCTYTASENVTTDALYCWFVESENKIAFTKSETIEETTTFYNSNYTINNEFKASQKGGQWVATCNGVEAERRESDDIGSVTIYAFIYTGSPLQIWANSNSNPSTLYNEDGTTYIGSSWTIRDGKVYLGGFEANYSPVYDKELPSVPVSSYVTNMNGNPDKLINSKVGLVVVMKQRLTTDEARTFSILLAANAGKNPCIYLY